MTVLCNRGSGGWRLLGRIDARLMQRTEPETKKEQCISEQLIQLFLPLRCPMRTWNWRHVANTPGARTCVESWKMLKAWHFRRWSDKYLYMFSEEFFCPSAGPVRGSHFQSILVAVQLKMWRLFSSKLSKQCKAFSLPQVQFERCGFFALDRKATKNYALLPSFVKLLSPTHRSRLQRKEAAWSLTAQSHKGARCSRSVPLEYCSASLKAKIDKNRSDFSKPKKGRAKETKKKATAPCPALDITEAVLNLNRLC